jgi:hypothetical protein
VNVPPVRAARLLRVASCLLVGALGSDIGLLLCWCGGRGKHAHSNGVD